MIKSEIVENFFCSVCFDIKCNYILFLKLRQSMFKGYCQREVLICNNLKKISLMILMEIVYGCFGKFRLFYIDSEIDKMF